MTERKWTAGPWVKRGQTNTVQGPEGNTVADVRYKNGKNDAQLIAAAPDLYEALDDLWTWVKNWDAEFMDDPEFDRTFYMNALAKARGESE